MDITVTTADIEEEGFAEAVRTRAAELLLADIDRAAIRDLVTASVATEIDRQVPTLVSEALARPIQRTTPWGEKRGETTTVLELIRERLEQLLEAPKSGRSYDSRLNLGEIVESAATTVVTHEMRSVVAEAKKRVAAEVQSTAVKAAVDALTGASRSR